MEIYKIESLGKTAHFITGSHILADSALPYKGKVFVSASAAADFRLIYSEEGQNFSPDICRAFSIFLARVRGYPFSEYELETPEGRKKLELKPCGHGGRIGKCKVLSTNKSCTVHKESIPVSFVMTPAGEYALMLCEKAEDFSADKIGKALCLMSGETSYPRGAMGFSECEDGVRISGEMFDGAELDSFAYGAAAALLTEILQTPSVNLFTDGDRVYATSEAGEISVYAKGGRVSRIYG